MRQCEAPYSNRLSGKLGLGSVRLQTGNVQNVVSIEFDSPCDEGLTNCPVLELVLESRLVCPFFLYCLIPTDIDKRNRGPRDEVS